MSVENNVTVCYTKRNAFGERLRELRQQKQISQHVLSRQVGVNWTYISKIESASLAPPSAETIRRIAQALDADENELLALAGKIPDGLRQAMKENPLLAELVRVLSKRVLPDEIYQQMIALAQEEMGVE